MTIKPGDIIGRLTILKSVPVLHRDRVKRGWKCECRCGSIVTKTAGFLRTTLKRGEHSCGCAQRGLPRGPSKGGQHNNGRQGIEDPTPDEIRE